MGKLLVISVFISIMPFLAVAQAQTVKTGTMTGQLSIKSGGTMSGGLAFFFDAKSGPPPSTEKYWRIPDYVATLGDNGKFSIQLPPGIYFMGAIKRKSGKGIGPPQEGDYLFKSHQKDGSQRTYTITSGEKLDIGSLAEAIPFKKELALPERTITAIEGRVTDPEGKPVAGALVFALVTPTKVGKPLFASERTGADGTYTVRVHQGGTYYLKVRSSYGGGPPKVGELVAESLDKERADNSIKKENKELVAVSVKNGEKLRNITLRIKKVGIRGPRAPVEGRRSSETAK